MSGSRDIRRRRRRRQPGDSRRLAPPIRLPVIIKPATAAAPPPPRREYSISVVIIIITTSVCVCMCVCVTSYIRIIREKNYLTTIIYYTHCSIYTCINIITYRPYISFIMNLKNKTADTYIMYRCIVFFYANAIPSQIIVRPPTLECN